MQHTFNRVVAFVGLLVSRDGGCKRGKALYPIFVVKDEFYGSRGSIRRKTSTCLDRIGETG